MLLRGRTEGKMMGCAVDDMDSLLGWDFSLSHSVETS